MNKPKIVLAGICLLAAAGGALAFKARTTTYYIKTAPAAYVAVEAVDPCNGGPKACTTETFGSIYTLYLLPIAPSTVYRTQFQPA